MEVIDADKNQFTQNLWTQAHLLKCLTLLFFFVGFVSYGVCLRFREGNSWRRGTLMTKRHCQASTLFTLLKHSSSEVGLKATKILFSFSKIQRSVHRKEKKIEDIHNIPKKQKKHWISRFTTDYHVKKMINM